MDRNLSRRVEAAFPLENKRIRERVISELEIYLNDNTQVWLPQNDSCYVPVENYEPECSVQCYLLEKFSSCLLLYAKIIKRYSLSLN